MRHSPRAFRDQPIDEVRQDRRLVGVERNKSNIAGARDQDRREGRKETPGRQVGLKNRQGAYADSKTINHRLERDEEMVEDAPPLFGSMRQTGAFHPVGPITRTRLASQEDMARDIGRLVEGRAFEQRRTHDQGIGFRQEGHTPDTAARRPASADPRRMATSKPPRNSSCSVVVVVTATSTCGRSA